MISVWTTSRCTSQIYCLWFPTDVKHSSFSRSVLQLVISPSGKHDQLSKYLTIQLPQVKSCIIPQHAIIVGAIWRQKIQRSEHNEHNVFHVKITLLDCYRFTNLCLSLIQKITKILVYFVIWQVNDSNPIFHASSHLQIL